MWSKSSDQGRELSTPRVSKIPLDAVVKSRYHNTGTWICLQLFCFWMEEAAEDLDTGGGFDFRPRVPFGQDDFNQLLVQVM